MQEEEALKQADKLPEMAFIKEHENGLVVSFRSPKTRTIVATRSFDFDDYIDGREETLYYAKNWRNEKYAQLLMEGFLFPSSANKYISTFNKVNINRTGVHRAIQEIRSKKDNIIRRKEVYVVNWIDKNGTNKLKTQIFLVSKYGRKQAKQEAMKFWEKRKELNKDF